MMVYVLRHGKAEHRAISGSDRDRALNERGRRQAAFIGERLAQMPEPPNVLIASPFLRTTQTAEIVGEAVGIRCSFDDRLICDAPVSAAIDLVEELSSLGATPCLVGHNPELQDLVAVLTQGPTGAIDHLRTGELACVEVHANGVGGAALVQRLRLEEV